MRVVPLLPCVQWRARARSDTPDRRCSRERAVQEPPGTLSAKRVASGTANRWACPGQVKRVLTAEREQVDRVLMLLDTMAERGVAPDLISYNTALSACQRAADWDAHERVPPPPCVFFCTSRGSGDSVGAPESCSSLLLSA